MSSDSEPRDTTRIVIIGAGFGGVRAAQDIARGVKERKRRDVTVTVIDQNPYHTYTPLLYKLAALPPEKGAAAEAAIAYPLAELFEGTDIRRIEDSVKELDLVQGDVHLARGAEVRADYLILAPGSETNYFGIPGLEEHSLPLKTLANAKDIRGRLMALPPGAHIVIGGGGPSGIELAAEIKLNHPSFDVRIVEAMPALLPGFDPVIVAHAGERLKRLGVIVVTNDPLTEARPDRIIQKSGAETPFDLLIWTGGVKASGLLASLPLRLDPKGRIEPGAGMECAAVSPDLEFGPMIYALGDAVCVHDAAGKPVPGMARTAIRQAEVVATNILRDLDGKSRAEHVAYRHITYPYVIPTGGRSGLSRLGPVILRGPFGWLFKEAIEIFYLSSVLPFGRALKVWGKGLRI